MSNKLVVKSDDKFTFESFKKNYKPSKNELSLQIIYLIAIEELPFREIARIIRKSKQYVVDKAHKYSDVILSIKMEYRLNELKKLRASKRDIFISKASFLGAATKELENRSISENELSKIPINKLIEIVQKLSDSVDTKVTHKTSFTESTVMSDLSFEKDIYIEEEG